MGGSGKDVASSNGGPGGEIHLIHAPEAEVFQLDDSIIRTGLAHWSGQHAERPCNLYNTLCLHKGGHPLAGAFDFQRDRGSLSLSKNEGNKQNSTKAGSHLSKKNNKSKSRRD